MGLVRSIPGRFIAAFQSLTIWDIVLLPKAFAKIVGVFVGIAGDFISWAGGTIWSLLEIIFSVLAPAAVPYLKKAAAAFRTILKNPIGFVGNLVRAAKQGFMQFAGRFLTHLKNSLIQWLTGALPGVYIPQALNLREIIKFVLSVLGLTWANIRAKLVKAVGETAVKAMETGFDIVVTLVTQGPAAAWDKIKEALANLQAMVIDAVMDFVKSKVVEAAVTKLLSMLSPAGAFIQAIIAIYNTIMFFIERLRQIAQVAMSFIDSIAAIASGVIATAANKVETTLAGFLTLVISFLARIAGLGKVSDAVMNVINKVREPIDRGLDLVVNWIVAMARSLGRFVAQAGVPQDPNERLRLGLQASVSLARTMRGRLSSALLTPALAAVKVRYGFSDLQAFPRNRTVWVRGRVNPPGEVDTGESEGAETDEQKARRTFGMGTFTNQQLATLLGIAQRTARLRTQTWRDSGILYAMLTEQTYTFDASKVAAPAVAPGEHPSRFVNKTTWEVLPTVSIRDTFYKKNFRAASMTTVRNRANSGQVNPANEPLYRCGGGGGPNHLPLVTQAQYEIDHVVDVTVHWNDGDSPWPMGRATAQDARNDWYDDATHLAVLCGSCNASKRKGRYLKRVEIGFRGPNDNP
jgi:hypothetical protein